MESRLSVAELRCEIKLISVWRPTSRKWSHHCVISRKKMFNLYNGGFCIIPQVYSLQFLHKSKDQSIHCESEKNMTSSGWFSSEHSVVVILINLSWFRSVSVRQSERCTDLLKSLTAEDNAIEASVVEDNAVKASVTCVYWDRMS